MKRLPRLTGIRRLGILGGGGAIPETPLEFIFRDEFVTADEAPVASPRTTEPGGQALTLVQTDGEMSIASGYISFPEQTTPAWTDQGYVGPAITRAPGVMMAVLMNAPTIVSKESLVCFLSKNAALSYTNTLLGSGWLFTGSGDKPRPVENSDGSGFPTNLSTNYWVSGVDNIFTQIMRAAGVLFVFNDQLVYVAQTINTNPVYPVLNNFKLAHTEDYLRVAQLAAPWVDDRGIATYYDATPAANDTATGEFEAHQYIEWTPAAGETFEIMYRRVDDDNTMILRCIQATSTMSIVQKVGGVETVLMTNAAVTWTVGTKYRVGLRYQLGYHYAWQNYAAKLYWKAVAHQSTYNLYETGCKVTGFTTAEDWEIYPVWLSGAALTELRRYTNPYYGGYRTQNVISVADGGDIAAACASMRRGDIISLAAGGTYNLGAGTTGFVGFKGGFSDTYRSEIRGNGATINGGYYGAVIAGLEYFKISDLTFNDQVLYCYQINGCRHFELDNVTAGSNVGGNLYDVTHFDKDSYGLIKDCTVLPSTGGASCDGFEVYGTSYELEFRDCEASGVHNGFEVWTGAVPSGANKNISWVRCYSHDNDVGFSVEGGEQDPFVQINCVATDCTAADNSIADYEGREGSTCYRHNSPGTTNGTVVDL